jgi:uncharacterized protein YccT (UPF0319 family)
MAKIQEKQLVIKLSKLLKDSDPEIEILSDETIVQLYQVIQELAGPGTLVEMEEA